LNGYGYALFNPLSYFDSLGLSASDVEKIHTAFRETLDQMTKAGLRNQNALINNALSPSNTLWYVKGLGLEENYLICYEQTNHINKELKKLNLDDTWEFTMQDNESTRSIFNPGHYWGQAKSMNSSDPLITYDPLRDRIVIDYKKP